MESVLKEGARLVNRPRLPDAAKVGEMARRGIVGGVCVVCEGCFAGNKEHENMIGAIIGDIAGSRFEWRNCKSKHFQLLTPECRVTDDSVMTLAVADALLKSDGDRESLSRHAVESMQAFGRRWARGCYGGRFSRWLMSEHPQPYGSFGNGSGMRVSPCAWAAASLEDALDMADRVTRVTHDHPEGLRGAEAVTAVIWYAGKGESSGAIRKIVEESWYRLDFTLDEIRDDYGFDVSCQGSVPQAIEAFLEAESVEDAVRNAVSLGGDSDTIAAMAGSMAEARFGVPADLRAQALSYLDAPLVDVLERFERRFPVSFPAASSV